MRRGAATILLFGAALAAAVALATLLTGGMAWPAIGVTSRDPLRPFLAAVLLAGAAAGAGGFRPLLERGIGARGRRARRVAILAAASLFVFSLAWSSRAAGGSDSSCYVLQAEAFARGRAGLDSPVAAALPDAPDGLFAPTGFVPSPTVRGRAVPICAPGLALAMAGADLVRPAAVFLVVPISAALLVWLTFVYGRQLDGDATGACSAVLVACSPIVLYQSVQPMSDVPAAAAWVAALVSTSPLAAGLWASIAILIRPNLALLVLVLAVFRLKAEATGEAERNRLRRYVVFLLALLPGVVIMLALNAARYGSPFASGYGQTEALFSRAHVYANLLRYPRWVIETQTPFLLLALAAPWALRRDPARARLAWASLLSIALLGATYLAYTVFDDWWYIRFLLPALPLAIAMSVAVLRTFMERVSAAAAAFTLAAITTALSAWYVHGARDRHVLELQSLEARFANAGAYARTLPANAVVLAVQQSGSIRFHGDRDTLAWDAIPEDALDGYLAQLRASGRAPYLALEDGEDERFRMRFAGQRAATALDRVPDGVTPPPIRVRFYDLSF